MPRQQSKGKEERAGKSKANLGQKKAELEKTSKKQMGHMGGGEDSKAAKQQSTKRGTK
jgi:hypothetical protein